MPRPAALLLTPRMPWPLDDGGRVVLWQSVVAAARTHDVTLITFAPPAVMDEESPEPVRAHCARVVRVPFRPPSLPGAAFRGLVGPWPFTIVRYRAPAFSAAVREALARRPHEYALASHLHMAAYAGDLDGVPMVLREHNVEHRWMASYAAARGPSPAGWYARAQAARLRRVERELCERAALVLAIQEREAEALRKLAPRARVRTLPIGVDLGRFHEPSPAHPPVVLVPGSFRWQPNVEGAIRFLEEGWPRVRAAHPDARVRVAGKEPPESLRAAVARAGGEIAGNVPSMEEELERASMVVVPLWVGAGARVKIVEAMAARVPVVSTPAGADGLELDPECHYVAGETPAALADGVSALLRSRPERLRLAAQGRALAETRWDAEAVGRLQARLIAEALSGGARA